MEGGLGLGHLVGDPLVGALGVSCVVSGLGVSCVEQVLLSPVLWHLLSGLVVLVLGWVVLSLVKAL